MTFSEAVVKARQARGLSQADLARALGVHRSYVNRIENGTNQTRPEMVERVRVLLDLAESWNVVSPRSKKRAA